MPKDQKKTERPKSWAAFIATVKACEVSDDFLAERHDGPPQARPELCEGMTPAAEGDASEN